MYLSIVSRPVRRKVRVTLSCGTWWLLSLYRARRGASMGAHVDQAADAVAGQLCVRVQVRRAFAIPITAESSYGVTVW